MSAFTAVGFFIVSLFFTLIVFSLWLRIALRYLRVSSLHPVSQLIHTITDPFMGPVNQLLKQKFQPGQKYDKTAIGVLVLVEILKMICLSLLAFHTIMPLQYVLIYVIADLIIQPCDLLFYAILVRVIMSFVNPTWQSPIADLLRMLTEPLLKLGRRIIPDISGFDFSPYFILMLLKVITLFIHACLPWRLL